MIGYKGQDRRLLERNRHGVIDLFNWNHGLSIGGRRTVRTKSTPVKRLAKPLVIIVYLLAFTRSLSAGMAAVGGNDTAALLFRFEADPPE